MVKTMKSVYTFKVIAHKWLLELVGSDFPASDMLRYDHGCIMTHTENVYTVQSMFFTQKRWESFGVEPYDLVEHKLKDADWNALYKSI